MIEYITGEVAELSPTETVIECMGIGSVSYTHLTLPTICSV